VRIRWVSNLKRFLDFGFWWPQRRWTTSQNRFHCFCDGIRCFPGRSLSFVVTRLCPIFDFKHVVLNSVTESIRVAIRILVKCVRDGLRKEVKS
jgi:hypothetical protein